MESLYLKLMGLFEKNTHLVDKVPLTEMRRTSLKLYGQDVEYPFEYVLARGCVSGCMILVFSILYGLLSDLDGLTLAVLGVSALPMGIFAEQVDIKRKLTRREREATLVFARLASNCSMFLGSGMSVRKAFIMSTEGVEENAYTEVIEKAVSDLNTNANTREVFASLNGSLRHSFVAEFTSILDQIEKYGSGSNADLDRLIKTSWQTRRDLATQSAKEMETKLVFPSMLIFSGVMLMIAVGLLMQLSG